MPGWGLLGRDALVAEIARALGRRWVRAASFSLSRLIRDPELPAQLFHRYPVLSLLQYFDDLLLRKPRLPHSSLFHASSCQKAVALDCLCFKQAYVTGIGLPASRRHARSVADLYNEVRPHCAGVASTCRIGPPPRARDRGGEFNGTGNIQFCAVMKPD